MTTIVGPRHRLGRTTLAPYLFILPFASLFAFFVLAPMLYAAQLSLFRQTIVGGNRFVWFDNYARALVDPDFWDGVSNMLLFGAIFIPTLIAFALAAALILDTDVIRRKSLFRIGIFLPYAIPAVISTLLWGYLYGRNYGPVAQIAKALDLRPPNFLSDGMILPSLANVAIWQSTGYYFVILYAALQSIPTDLADAAAIDGANRWTYAWHVKIPIIAPTISIVLVFAVIGTLQLFNEPYLLRIAAPDVINVHFTPNIYAYGLAFINHQYNYSAAISFAIGALVAILSYLLIWSVSRRSGGKLS
ncbi:MAG: sugar ABC transporter permease [Proteobacteria bacterium]|nr:sugar ABC transporter permease [Pseudomonadota bacterium]MBI3496717.1 sugar ABC transporter permease [Pseudomonadota bacterium]